MEKRCKTARILQEKAKKKNSLIIRCCLRTLMKSKVLKPSSSTSWFSHSRSSLAVWGGKMWDFHTPVDAEFLGFVGLEGKGWEIILEAKKNHAGVWEINCKNSLFSTPKNTGIKRGTEAVEVAPEGKPILELGKPIPKIPIFPHHHGNQEGTEPTDDDFPGKNHPKPSGTQNSV